MGVDIYNELFVKVIIYIVLKFIEIIGNLLKDNDEFLLV